jgi:hypothetical protein
VLEKYREFQASQDRLRGFRPCAIIRGFLAIRVIIWVREPVSSHPSYFFSWPV